MSKVGVIKTAVIKTAVIKKEVIKTAVINQRVKELMGLPQPVQLSPEWFEMRKGKITASSAASLLLKSNDLCKRYIEDYSLPLSFADGSCANPYSDKNDYILKKCGHINFTGSPATFFGQRFESVAQQVYSLKMDTSVIEFGLIAHQTHSFLGASPDGITPKGVMLEIKCPYRRKITGIPPFYYWIQVQLQLEVADLDRCHFLECTFKEISQVEYSNLPEKTDARHGLFLQLLPSENECVYPKSILSVAGMEKWKAKQQKIYSKTKVIYWRLDKFKITKIKRDKEWFKHALNDLKEAWVEVEGYKKNGCADLLGVDEPNVEYDLASDSE